MIGYGPGARYRPVQDSLYFCRFPGMASPDVRGHGIRCSCEPCKAYRRDGQRYESRVRREYAFALARLRVTRTERVSRAVRTLAWADAQALAHALGCQCPLALKQRQEAARVAFDSPVVFWDLLSEVAECKRFPYVPEE